MISFCRSTSYITLLLGTFPPITRPAGVLEVLGEALVVVVVAVWRLNRLLPHDTKDKMVAPAEDLTAYSALCILT